MNYKGSCHCGRIRYEVEGELGDVIECNCSHCSRKGYLLWFMPLSKVAMKSPPSSMSTYKFNKHVIDHHFCPVCGVAPIAFGTDQKGQGMASVNVRCLEGVDVARLNRIAFDGRVL